MLGPRPVGPHDVADRLDKRKTWLFEIFQGDVMDRTRFMHFRPLMCVTRLCPPFLAALWPLPELQEEVDIPVRRPRQTQFGVPKRRKCVVPFAGLDRRIPLVVDDSLEVVDDVLEGWALQPSSDDDEEQAQQRDEDGAAVAPARAYANGRHPTPAGLLLRRSR